MKIAVVGHKGRLGSELINQGCIPFDCDITRTVQVQEAIKATIPDVIINCAAITDVDSCEQIGIYKKAVAISKMGIMNLLQLFNGRVIYISTDYVFDGRNGAYSENIKPNPISNYGFSKYLGEQVFLGYQIKRSDILIRTTILYGGNKPDFVTKTLDQLKEGKPFTVPMNLFGTPTYIPHLAEALIKLSKMKDAPKIVHIAGEDVLSRYEFALMIAGVFGYNKELILPAKWKWDMKSANRPKKAGLKTNLAKKIGLPIYTVLSGLQEMKNEPTNII